MKLGWLVVLAVVVLVPSLSESRIVSRCELKNELSKAIILPQPLERHRGAILETVTYTIFRKSQLNTSLVSEADSATEELGSGMEEIDEGKEDGKENEVMEGKPKEENREKEDKDGGEHKKKLFQNKHWNKQGPKRKARPGPVLSTGHGPASKHLKKKLPVTPRPFSKGWFGLFQLSAYFCDAGHDWSRNVCETSCTAFTDDDISDDIACFVKTRGPRYWRLQLRKSRQHAPPQDFFEECN